MLQQSGVGQSVANIGELVSELLAKGRQLIAASEVECAVRGEDTGEETKVVRNAMGKSCVGCGSEEDGAPRGVLLFQILEQFAVVGKMSYIQSYG
jgi:hypothetical protein